MQGPFPFLGEGSQPPRAPNTLPAVVTVTRVLAFALADKSKRWVGRRGRHSPSDGLEDRVSLQVLYVLADGGAQPLPRLPMLLQPLHRRLVVVPQVGLGSEQRLRQGGTPCRAGLPLGPPLAPACQPTYLCPRPTLTAPSISMNQRRSMDWTCTWLRSLQACRTSCLTWSSSSRRRRRQYRKVRAVFQSRMSCGQAPGLSPQKRWGRGLRRLPGPGPVLGKALGPFPFYRPGN